MRRRWRGCAAGRSPGRPGGCWSAPRTPSRSRCSPATRARRSTGCARGDRGRAGPRRRPAGAVRTTETVIAGLVCCGFSEKMGSARRDISAGGRMSTTKRVLTQLHRRRGGRARRRPVRGPGRPVHRRGVRRRAGVRAGRRRPGDGGGRHARSRRGATPRRASGSGRCCKFADAVEARADELVAAESQNTGKPLGLTASEELPPAVDQIRFFAGAARLLEGRSAGRVPGRPRRATCGASRSASARRSRRGTTR